MIQFSGTEAEVWQQEMNLPKRGKKQSLTQALTISSAEQVLEQNTQLFCIKLRPKCNGILKKKKIKVAWKAWKEFE